MSAALTARQVQALRAVAAGDAPNRTISIPNAVAAALAVIAEQEAELRELDGMKRRAREMADQACTCDGCPGCAALRILGVTS